MSAELIYEMIRREKVIVIVRGIEKGRIVNVAQAVLAAGVKMLEVTCNTAVVFEMLELLNEKMGDKMLIGAGTVITTNLCKKAHRCRGKIHNRSRR